MNELEITLYRMYKGQERELYALVSMPENVITSVAWDYSDGPDAWAYVEENDLESEILEMAQDIWEDPVNEIIEEGI
jgi:hypothetical protein